MLGARPVILGVQTTVLRDRAFDKALIVEDTLVYFAQDVTGNVWYLGEFNPRRRAGACAAT